MLSNPAKHFPSLFGNIELFITYPYLLPCLCSASISFVGFINGLLFLPETCKNLTYHSLPDEEQADEDITYDENAPTYINTSSDLIHDQSDTNLKRIPSKRAIHSLAAAGVYSQGQKLGKCAILTAIAFSALVFQNIFWVEVFPLWAAAPPGIGLGFKEADIGQVMSFIGIFNLVSLLIFYPRLSNYYTPLTLFRVPAMFQNLSFFIGPLISTFIVTNSNLSYLVKPSIIILFAFKALLDSTCATSQMMLVNSSAKP